MNENKLGIIAIITACVLWGNFVLIYAYLSVFPPIDIVAHRILWGFLSFLGVITYQKRLKELRTTLKNPKTIRKLVLSALLVSTNWLGFVWAVGNQKTIDAGLGYFLFPFFSVALGLIFKGERLRPLQALAIIIAASAVGILAFGLGRLPFIALFLGLTFALYGFVKSNIEAGPVMSVTVENILLLPFAIIWVVFFADYSRPYDAPHIFWLIMAGFLTALALMNFSRASKILPLSTMGILFFINPIIQIFNGAIILKEPLTEWHIMASPLIAIAVILYSYDLWQYGQKIKRKTD